MTVKTKRTVSLDADLVEALGEGNLSAELNDALRERVEKRRRHEAMGRWLDDERAAGAVFDEEGVQFFVRLLEGGDSVAQAS